MQGGSRARNIALRLKASGASETGSTLLIVIGLTLALSIGTMFLISRVTSSAQLQARLSVKGQLSPKTEAAATVLVRLVQNYFKARKPIEDLSAYLQGQAPSVLPEGTSLERLDVEVSPKKSFGLIRTGPYKGLFSLDTNIKILLTLKDSDRPQVTESVEVLAAYSGISFLQFSQFLFGDGWGWGGYSMGRVHANGKVCMGWPTAFGMPNFESLTSADRILDPEGPECYQGTWTARGLPLKLFAKMSDGSNKELNWNAVHGCTNCAGTGLDWKEYAEVTYEGRVKDKDHGVEKLEILSPETLADPNVKVQGTWGYDYRSPTAKAFWGAERKERLILEPVQQGDSADVKSVRFAYNADIRIINGVWYLRNPSNPDDWPGVPVWSDHPGRFKTDDSFEFGALAGATEFVGQDDIRDRWAGTGYDWGSEPPKHYSYYRYANGEMQPDTWAVISYGNLKRLGAGNWKPGYLVSNRVQTGATRFADNLCTAPAICTNCGAGTYQNDMLLAADPASDPKSVICSDGDNPRAGTLVLYGARGGYRNGQFLLMDMAVSPATTPMQTDPTRDKRSKILPMNFDFDAFQRALVCDPAGHRAEVGCYFGANKFMGRPFNGVVFVTSTWENWRVEACDFWSTPQCAGSAPGRMMPLPPFQGAILDADQPGGLSHEGQQEALPYALCGAASVDLAGGKAGENFDRVTNAKFKIPNCRDYVWSKVVGTYKPVHPGELRLFNAATMNGAVLPHGISIVTPTVATIMGNVNTSSDVSSGRATPWLPFLLGSDYNFNVSANWEDQYAPWDVTTDNKIKYGDLPGKRLGTDITTNMAMIGSTSGFILEDFRGKSFNSTFSQVFLTSPVYVYTPMYYPEGDVNGYQPAHNNNAWDPHFNYPENLPPGVPLMNVFTLKSWKWRARR